jgi:hypothetical protein
MKLKTMLDLLAEASALSGQTDYIVIGSLSILALEENFDVPHEMAMSNDVACYTRADPERIFDVMGELGEHSPRHRRTGCFIDPVSPALPSLPDGWEARLNAVARAGVKAWCLDPNDAALSKYARGEPRDRRWIRAGLRASVVSMPIVRSRLQRMEFFDQQEADKARQLIDEDEAWFQQGLPQH